MDGNDADLPGRLARLERRCRRWQMGTLACLLGLAGLTLAGATRPVADNPAQDFRGTLSARRFDVVGDDGKLLGSFGLPPVASRNAEPQFFLNHATSTHASFGILQINGRPTLGFYPADGNAKVELGIDRAGGGFLKLSDKADRETFPK